MLDQGPGPRIVEGNIDGSGSARLSWENLNSNRNQVKNADAWRKVALVVAMLAELLFVIRL